MAALASIMALAACAASSPPPSAAAPRSSQYSPETSTPPDAPAPSLETLQRLSTIVESLQVAGQDRAHSGIVLALQELANALEPLPGVPATTAPQLRDFARQLAGSPPSSSGHAELLQQALRRVLQVLRNEPPPERQGEKYEQALAALEQALGELQPKRTLIDQRTPVLEALRSATNAVSLAMQQPLPFPEAQPSPPPSAAIGSPEQQLEQSRQRLSELAAVSWSDRRLTSAHALSALADLVESLDVKRAATARVSAIRAQAMRLEDADSLSFTRLDWIASGLDSALDSLGDLGATDARGMAPWLKSARQRVEQLQGGGSIAFQAAAIQDAFRTTFDAFQAWLTLPCRSRSEAAHGTDADQPQP